MKIARKSEVGVKGFGRRSRNYLFPASLSPASSS